MSVRVKKPIGWLLALTTGKRPYFASRLFCCNVSAGIVSLRLNTLEVITSRTRCEEMSPFWAIA